MKMLKQIYPRYRNGAFVAFHGSTNRAPYPQSGYFVGFVPFKNGKPSRDYEIFADGFAQVDPIVNVRNAKYRPMGIAFSDDGSMYIADSRKGKIWRIEFQGKRENFGKKQLNRMEKRKQLSHFATPDIENDIIDMDEKKIEVKKYFNPLIVQFNNFSLFHIFYNQYKSKRDE